MHRRGVSERPAWVVLTHADLPNGPAHRLVAALRQAGYPVGMCAVPLPGAASFRAETLLPGSTGAAVVADARPVKSRQELRSAIDLARFAWSVAREGRKDLVLVGCDPVSFVEGLVAFRLAPIRVRAAAVWFVDWSAQRLERRLTGAVYLGATRVALGWADVVAAISPAAGEVLAGIGRGRHEVLVLPNQPLASGSGPAWASRPLAVGYVGGLSDHQGADILLDTARILSQRAVAMEIVGAGPAGNLVATVTATLPNVRFHGLLENVGQLAHILHRTRVGCALYDPDFAMHAYNDPLKIKDYLAAGLRVVSTLPSSVDDGAVTKAAYSTGDVVEATLRALSEPPVFDPSQHSLLTDARRSLKGFVTAVEGRI